MWFQSFLKMWVHICSGSIRSVPSLVSVAVLPWLHHSHCSLEGDIIIWLKLEIVAPSQYNRDITFAVNISIFFPPLEFLFISIFFKKHWTLKNWPKQFFENIYPGSGFLNATIYFFNVTGNWMSLDCDCCVDKTRHLQRKLVHFLQ